MLENKLSVARGNTKADLVLKNANVVNVFTETIERLDVAICEGTIVGLGEYSGNLEINCEGQYVVPGFIDGHIHLESSMLKPVEFAKAVLPPWNYCSNYRSPRNNKCMRYQWAEIYAKGIGGFTVGCVFYAAILRSVYCI